MIAYSIGLLSGIFALCTKQYILGMLILFYINVQLSEAVIWKGIDSNNKQTNKRGTKLLIYTLYSHLFAVGIGVLLEIKYNQKRDVVFKDFIPILIGLLFWIFAVKYTTKNSTSQLTYPLDPSRTDKSCQNMNNRLVWPFNANIYYISYVLTMIIFYVYRKSNLSYLVIFSTFFFSYVGISRTTNRVRETLWCFSAAVLAPILVLVNYFITKK